MGRRKARENALQVLYQLGFAAHDFDEAVKERGSKLEKEDYAFYTQLINNIDEHKVQLDELIQRHLKEGWQLDRISPVDRIILRMATYELKYDDTPPKAVINEAVELTKKFSSFDSSRYINGVLGKILGDLGG